MALNARDIKRRKKSISNIGQIAKAMEVVSVTKMRKSQKIALNTRFYVREAMEILKTVSRKVDSSSSFFLEERLAEKSAVLLITSDKGLCGGLNANIFRQTEKLISELTASNSEVSAPKIDFITVGRKGGLWCQRKKFNIIKSFLNFGDYADFEETAPVGEFVIDIFKNKKYDRVFAIYTNFLNVLKQEAVLRTVLPLKEESLKEIIKGIAPTYGRFAELRGATSKSEVAPLDKWNFEYKFEPNIKTVLDNLLYNLVRVKIYYIVLESNASEHSARRMAMKNASDNAEDIIKELNLSFNKARQAAITKEISEIAAA